MLSTCKKAFDDPYFGTRNNPDAEANIEMLLSAWRRSRLPVIHVRHCSVEPDSPLRPDLPGNQVKPQATPWPGERQFSKSVNSAFIGTGLQDYLQERAVSSLVVVGLTTDHCVSTSVRMAANLGFEVTLVADATATFEREGPDGIMYSAEQMHRVHLASLHGEFGRVLSARQVLDEVMADVGAE